MAGPNATKDGKDKEAIEAVCITNAPSVVATDCISGRHRLYRSAVPGTHPKRNLASCGSQQLRMVMLDTFASFPFLGYKSLFSPIGYQRRCISWVFISPGIYTGCWSFWPLQSDNTVALGYNMVHRGFYWSRHCTYGQWRLSVVRL